MIESLFAVTTLWVLFAITPGPFWTAVMRTASDYPAWHIYREYGLYFITGWLTFNIAIGLLVYAFGQFSPALIAWIHVLGIGVLGWLTWKMFRAQQFQGHKFDFHWKAMSALTWTNPKCWLLIPLGFLGANFTDHIVINIVIFYALGAPVFFGVLYFWIMVGKLGAQVSLTGIRWFNIALMVLFSAYLGFRGYQEMIVVYG